MVSPAFLWAAAMVTRLYVDNFRCLVNFELKLDETNILLGPNGSLLGTSLSVLRGQRLAGDTAFEGEERLLDR